MSTSDCAEWVDFAQWWSCIGKSLCSLQSTLVITWNINFIFKKTWFWLNIDWLWLPKLKCSSLSNTNKNKFNTTCFAWFFFSLDNWRFQKLMFLQLDLTQPQNPWNISIWLTQVWLAYDRPIVAQDIIHKAWSITFWWLLPFRQFFWNAFIF